MNSQVSRSSFLLVLALLALPSLTVMGGGPAAPSVLPEAEPPPAEVVPSAPGLPEEAPPAEVEGELFYASHSCPGGEYPVHCVIDPDPCGRRFTADGCCPNGTTASCVGIPSGTPLCLMGVAVVCS